MFWSGFAWKLRLKGARGKVSLAVRKGVSVESLGYKEALCAKVARGGEGQGRAFRGHRLWASTVVTVNQLLRYRILRTEEYSR